MSDTSEHQIDWSRLGRYLAGECSAPEAEEIRRWIDADPTHTELVASLSAMWQSGGEFPSAPPTLAADEERAWRAMRARVAGLEVEPRRQPIIPHRRPILTPLTRSRTSLPRIAAAAVLVIGATLAWELRPEPRPSAIKESWREVATSRGQRASIRLGERTQILLGVASKLRYKEPFLGGTRDIYLEGEAYFDVTHDPAKPFVVHAGNAVARDLGTTFVVRAYAGDSAVRVVVARGTVALRPASVASGAVLEDHALGVVDASGGVRVTPNVRVDSYLAWTRGELAFSHAPLRAVLAELARWYDVVFWLADPALGERPVTLTMRDDAIEHVLDGLALLVDARYERRGRVVTLYPRQQIP